MRYPEFLHDGGTIGFVAPSFGCATQPYEGAFNHALEKFKAAGFHTSLGPNCYAAAGIGISNQPDLCAKELQKMYESADNDVLISCGGGELMCEILEYLDFEKLKKAEPKWFLGYSDNTNFTFLQTTICDTASIYGPCAASFGMEPWHKAIADTFSLIQGKKLMQKGYSFWEKESLKSEDNPTAPYNPTEPRQLVCFDADESTIGKIGKPDKLDKSEHTEKLDDTKKTEKLDNTENTEKLDIIENTANQDNTISMKGRLLGGCMDCLVTLLGTRYDHVEAFNKRYEKDGVIWFLESCDLNVFAIRRAMWQMDQAGWFQNVKGFLIGRPLVHGQKMMGLDQYEAVMGIARKYHVPVIMDADLGHIPPAMPIICGAMAEIRATENEISVDMKLQ